VLNLAFLSQGCKSAMLKPTRTLLRFETNKNNVRTITEQCENVIGNMSGFFSRLYFFLSEFKLWPHPSSTRASSGQSSTRFGLASIRPTRPTPPVLRVGFWTNGLLHLAKPIPARITTALRRPTTPQSWTPRTTAKRPFVSDTDASRQRPNSPWLNNVIELRTAPRRSPYSAMPTGLKRKRTPSTLRRNFLSLAESSSARIVTHVAGGAITDMGKAFGNA
jgi:hypothetical protein